MTDAEAKREISARIPLQPQCAHWGSFSPGEAFGVRLSVLPCLGPSGRPVPT